MPTLATIPDGLSAAFCGTGSPLPDRQRAGPCLAVIAGRHLFVFDAGEGSAETLSLMGFSPARVEAVFLTHFHSDHIDGLGNLALQHWAQGAATAPLPLYGGGGVERVASGFNEAYALDSSYRIAHHGPSVVPPSGFGLTPHAFTIADNQESAIVFEDGGVRITAFHVDHGPVHPAFGYRIDYSGRSIVISGDTAPSEALQRQAANADLLVHEGLSPELVGIMEQTAREQHRGNLAKIFHDIVNYHTSPERAAAIAQAAHVHALTFTHIIPQMPIGALEGPFLGNAAQHFRGPIYIAHDGDIIMLPAAGGMTRRSLF
ncbi:MAG: MBL fold metallo-hydrolase [Proteobacteria bacterium]|nr:MBL fold metallo-hydrolase [Pseudomonadota bacterium]